MTTTVLLQRLGALGLGLVALASLGGRARAIEPLYLGQASHLRVDLGASIFTDSDADTLGLSPILSGRIAIGRDYGLALTLPTSFVSVSDTSRFKLGNPSLAFELVDDAQEYKRAVLRFGVALPVASVSSGNIGDTLVDGIGYASSALGRGNVDAWLWAPDTLSLFAEFHTTAFITELYADLRFSIAGLFPTGDGDFELLLQTILRFGYDGGTFIPFAGLSLVWLPTQDGDAFQSGLQLGAVINLGGPSIDVVLQVNLDDPGGFSFDDGVLGVQVGATIPF